MQSSLIRTVLLGLALTLAASCSPTVAQESEELAARARALKAEAAELFEKGQNEQAERLLREVQELMHKAKQRAEKKRSGEFGEDHPAVRELKERLNDLRAAMRRAEAVEAPEHERNEIREQLHQTERRLEQLMPHGKGLEIPPQFRAQAEEIEKVSRRIHHMRVAAENLEAAELHDLAHEVTQSAEKLEREVQAAKEEIVRAMKRDGEHRDHEPDGEIRRLQAENEGLRNELRELREVVEHLKKERVED